METSQSLCWDQCAGKDGDECKFIGHRLLRYGENDNYIIRLGNLRAKCDISYFGFDPSPNKLKSCHLYNGTVAWKLCSSDGIKCQFTGTKFVRYGAGSAPNGGGWNIKIFTDGTDCNNLVFKDTLVNNGKSCYTGEDFDPSKFYWKYCAKDGERCNFKGTQVVRYGLNDSWVYYVGTDSTECNSRLLGDPSIGMPKICQIQAINEDSCPNDVFLNGKQCVSKCPDETFVSIDKKSCLTECPGTQVFLTRAKYCIEECPNGYFLKKRECIPCEAGTFTSLDQSSCVSKCPDTQFLIKSAKRCYAYCPSLYKTILGTNECIYDCAENNLLITADHGYCTDTCPEGQFKLGTECFFDCPYGYFRNGKECVAICPEGSYRSADNRSCVTQCRDGNFLLKADKQCYSRCPLYSLVSGNECVYSCPSGTYKSYDNYECLTKCPKDHFLYRNTNSCHSNCPANLFLLQNECVELCPTGTVLSADRRNCLSSCDKSQFLLGIYNSCFFSCPFGYSHGTNQCK
jgi:hypothetical protein